MGRVQYERKFMIKIRKPITSFSGAYRFLSNFYPAEILVEFIMYPTVEHAYQAMKTLDVKERKKVALLEKPGDVKRYGRTLRLREDWDVVKLTVMKNLCTQKFDFYSLRKKLLDTYPLELIEGNTWGDTFWGQCPLGNGENHLGKILMKVREELM